MGSLSGWNLIPSARASPQQDMWLMRRIVPHTISVLEMEGPTPSPALREPFSTQLLEEFPRVWLEIATLARPFHSRRTEALSKDSAWVNQTKNHWNLIFLSN